MRGDKVEGQELVVVRQIDKNGRVGIPAEVRRYLNLKVNDEVQFFIGENGVYICPYKSGIRVGDLRKRKKE